MTMTRREFTRLAGGGVAAAATTGLAGPARVAAQEKVSLKYLSVARGEPRRQAILQVVERFEKANPTIEVALSEVPFDQYFQKVSVSLAAGSGVDAFDVDSPLVASYAHQDVLLPLDEYVDRKDWEDFLEQERQIATYNGKILTLPWSSSSQAVFYNLDMVKEAGITPWSVAAVPSGPPSSTARWSPSRWPARCRSCGRSAHRSGRTRRSSATSGRSRCGRSCRASRPWAASPTSSAPTASTVTWPTASSWAWR
jgi:maltose-binding protein MalE